MLTKNLYFQESPKFSNNIFFCTDTDIGILRQPIDGNPYKNAAVLGSGTKVSCPVMIVTYSLICILSL